MEPGCIALLCLHYCLNNMVVSCHSYCLLYLVYSYWLQSTVVSNLLLLAVHLCCFCFTELCVVQNTVGCILLRKQWQLNTVVCTLHLLPVYMLYRLYIYCLYITVVYTLHLLPVSQLYILYIYCLYITFVYTLHLLMYITVVYTLHLLPIQHCSVFSIELHLYNNIVSTLFYQPVKQILMEGKN